METRGSGSEGDAAVWRGVEHLPWTTLKGELRFRVVVVVAYLPRYSARWLAPEVKVPTGRCHRWL